MNDRCTEIRERLEETLHAELPPGEAAAVEKHLADCADCRDYRGALLEDDMLLTGMTRSIDTRIERMEERVMESIAAQTVSRKRSSLRWPARVALAAAAALVLIVGWNLIFRGTGGNVAWADVIARVRDAQDFICRIDRVATPWDSVDIVAYHSKKYGQKKVMHIDGKLAAEVFVRPDEKVIHLLHHKDEAYVTIGLTSSDAKGLTDMTSAKDLVEYFHSYEYREIGTRDIDGVKAKGIEVSDPAMWAGKQEEGSVRLWVDASTNWPVLIERDFTSDEGKVHISETYRDFQWNPSLSKEDFEFEVPEGYGTLDFGETKEGEEGAIEGLRAYASLTDGRYPGDPAFDTAASEIRKDRDRLLEKGEWGPDEIKVFFKVRGLSVFYAELVEKGVEVEYNGSTVGSTDYDKVLMRWKLDEGRWRVIYGDLRAETIDIE
jgi:outer membrane lipoprotein-sorting protein